MGIDGTRDRKPEQIEVSKDGLIPDEELGKVAGGADNAPKKPEGLKKIMKPSSP